MLKPVCHAELAKHPITVDYFKHYVWLHLQNLWQTPRRVTALLWSGKAGFLYSVPPEERAARIELRKDCCVVDGAHFFIRGRLEIPIIDYPETLIWNVW